MTKIKQQMKTLSVTGSDFCRMHGLSENVISRISRGVFKASASTQTLIYLCVFLSENYPDVWEASKKECENEK